ncbi:cytochrome c [soil metagenome]
MIGRITVLRTCRTWVSALAALLFVHPVAAEDGASLFAQNCVACHQAKGQGIPGAFPALSRNAFVMGDPQAVATTLLNGRGGMPSFKGSLDDAQLAAVASYIRSNWGNAAAPIDAALFGSARQGASSTANRPMPVH